MTTMRVEAWRPGEKHISPDIERLNRCSPLEAALQYATFGWRVFPVGLNKAPLCEHGCLDASNDRSQIENWWKKYPNAGVAVATGRMSGVVVIDLDGPTGMQSWSDLKTSLGIREDTLRAVTGRLDGGRHLFYVSP